MIWTYGVTTVLSRRRDLLPQTLKSLSAGGFTRPRLFVDGDQDGPSWQKEFGLEVTARYPKINVYGNWTLAAMELYIREPNAERYAIFQDDILISKNCRQYLEQIPFPERGYQNLYTVPKNEERFPGIGQTGRRQEGIFWPSNQQGLGALGLVFDRQGLLTMLGHYHMLERPMDAKRGWRAVDGGIVTALRKSGWKEYVHNPSLVQHVGLLTTVGTNPAPVSDCFKGEEFDCLELLGEK